MTNWEIVFWSSTLLIIYAYVGFPLLTLVRAMVWRVPFKREEITPTVSVVICCHNEEQGIREKLENMLHQDYPQDQIEFLFASDGSSDNTESVISEYVGTRVQLLALPRNGKASALNACVEQATGEILVFSDANSIFKDDAICKLVMPFADDHIGGVAGNQVYKKSYSAGIAAGGEQSYWNFDRWMKTLQTQSGNTISATGAIYAIRKSLFQQVPDGVTDDFITSTRVIEQGYRLVFEPDAICYEPVAGSAKAEFGRKTRVITRGLRGVLAMRTLLNPFRYGFYSVQLLSHKVIRRLVGIPLIGIAIATVMLWNQGMIYQIAAVGQLTIYGLAILGYIAASMGKKASKPLSIPYFFCMINVASLVALLNIVRGKRITVWNPHRGEMAHEIPTTK